MNKDLTILVYIIVMAAVTYIIRMLPMVLLRRKITNRFIRSFLYYVPYVTLAAMTVPAIFYVTDSIWSAAAAFVVAVIFSLFGCKLVTVAAAACITVFIAEMIMRFI